jgi:hypothetical protein
VADVTLVYLLLGVGFVLPVGRIAWLITAEETARRDAAELVRLDFTDLPHPRQSLVSPHPTAWPQRQTPSDLPPRAVLVVAEDHPMGAQYVGRHRAPGPAEELTTTGQFWTIVANLDRPCAHCTTPEDGEPAHAGCPGCACPCRLAVAV